MNQKIHPYLIARLEAVAAAFQDINADATVRHYTQVAAVTPPKSNRWQDVIKEEDSDEGSNEGGGGTMRGHRAKNAEYAKSVMRKLTRR